VFNIVSGGKQAFDLLLAKDNRQFFNTGPGRDMQLGVVPFTNVAVKADNAGQIRVAGTPGQFAIFKQIANIFLNLIVGQGVGRLPVVLG
jgi:hypothetical protein